MVIFLYIYIPHFLSTVLKGNPFEICMLKFKGATALFFLLFEIKKRNINYIMI